MQHVENKNWEHGRFRIFVQEVLNEKEARVRAVYLVDKGADYYHHHAVSPDLLDSPRIGHGEFEVYL